MNEANTCGQCIHWHKLDAPRELGQPVQGECRQGPPHVTMVPRTTRSQFGQHVEFLDVTAYPRPSQDMPACGQFKRVLQSDEDRRLDKEFDEILESPSYE